MQTQVEIIKNLQNKEGLNNECFGELMEFLLLT